MLSCFIKTQGPSSVNPTALSSINIFFNFFSLYGYFFLLMRINEPIDNIAIVAGSGIVSVS